MGEDKTIESTGKSLAGFVYLIRGENDLFKIGKSKNPNRRAGHFAAQFPFKIEILTVIQSEDVSATEREYHAAFSAYRHYGEWFKLPFEIVKEMTAAGLPAAEPPLPKKRGGDTRLAAAKNGKKVGPVPKADTPFKRQIKVLLHDLDDDSLAAFAKMEGRTKQDLIREAISKYLIDRQIL